MCLVPEAKINKILYCSEKEIKTSEIIVNSFRITTVPNIGRCFKSMHVPNSWVRESFAEEVNDSSIEIQDVLKRENEKVHFRQLEKEI